MRILKTGHIIADTVAAALEEGLSERARVQAVNNGEWSRQNEREWNDIPIAYGILRGTADYFKNSERYIHLDRGYFKPNHFDGYYRISLNGTQQTTGIDQFEDDTRFKQLGIEAKPWRGFDKSKPVLICPPTEYVKGFFTDIDDDKWLKNAIDFLDANNLPYRKIRTKEMSMESAMPDMIDCNFVLTFNCSLGWKAMLNGIPCVSDPTHSMVGSWFKNIPLENLSEAQYVDRNKLFAAMANLQLSLEEIRAGKINKLISDLLGANHERDNSDGGSGRA